MYVLCMKLKPNIFMRIFEMIMNYLILVIIQLTKCDDPNKLVVSKINSEIGGVLLKDFLLKQLFLVDDSSECKKAKDVNKNFIARVSYGEYKEVFLNKKCLRHPIKEL